MDTLITSPLFLYLSIIKKVNRLCIILKKKSTIENNKPTSKQRLCFENDHTLTTNETTDSHLFDTEILPENTIIPILTTKSCPSCGLTNHQRSSSFKCPFNPKNQSNAVNILINNIYIKLKLLIIEKNIYIK